MRRMKAVDIVLLFFTLAFIIVDIAMAICLQFILPNYMMKEGWYSADGRQLDFSDAADICPCLFRVFPEGTDKKITMDKVLYNTYLKRSILDTDGSIELLTKYPFIVSLSIRNKSTIDSREFICNGIAVSEEKFVTSKSCIQSAPGIKSMIVRSESLYWSLFGNDHVVTDIIETDYNQLVELKVVPTFKSKIVPYVPVEYGYKGNWTYGFTIGWNEKLYDKNIVDRRKFRAFDVQEYTTVKPDKRYKPNYLTVCNKCDKNDVLTSKMLFTSCHQLIGFLTADGKVCGYSDLLKNKKCYRIYEDDHKIKKPEVCLIKNVENS